MDSSDTGDRDGSRKAIIMGLFILSVVLVAIFYRTDRAELSNSPPPSGAQSHRSQSSVSRPTKPPLSVSSDEIVIPVFGVNGVFQPHEISLLKGSKVRLAIRSTDGAYGFANQELHLDTGTIQRGTQSAVTFLAEKEGLYRLIATQSPKGVGTVLGIVKIRSEDK